MWGSLRTEISARFRPWWIWIGLFALFIWNAGTVELFDWDEINFAEIAREMLVLRDPWRVHVGFDLFWEKPPMYAWLQAISFRLLGVSEIAARLPNAICGVLTAVLCWHYGTRWLGKKNAWIWPILVIGSVLPHFYFRVGLIDPWFNLWIVWALCLSLESKWLRSGVALGCAVLTKGPVALILFAPALLNRKIWSQGLVPWIRLGLATFAVGGSWYLFQAIAYPELFSAFLDYQWRLFSSADAGHRGPWWYHGAVLALGCFPAIAGLLGLRKDDFRRDEIRVFLGLLIWVLVIFSVVQTKIVHYSSLAYLPIALLSARVGSLNRHALRVGWFIWSVVLLALAWILRDPGTVLTSIAQLTPNLGAALENGNLQSAFTIQNQWPWAWVVLVVLSGGLLVLSLIKPRPEHWKYHCLAGAVVAQALFGLVLPSVLQYTQGPHVAFAKTLRGRSCRLVSQDFRSYVQFFYAERPSTVGDQTSCQILVVKQSHRAPLDARSDLKLLGNFGYFAFYEKKIN